MNAISGEPRLSFRPSPSPAPPTPQRDKTRPKRRRHGRSELACDVVRVSRFQTRKGGKKPRTKSGQTWTPTLARSSHPPVILAHYTLSRETPGFARSEARGVRSKFRQTEETARIDDVNRLDARHLAAQCTHRWPLHP